LWRDNSYHGRIARQRCSDSRRSASPHPHRNVQMDELNLFNGIFNSILTVVTLLFLLRSYLPLFNGRFVDSFWLSTAEQCRAGDGACWSIIPANIRFIIFGFYPHELHWRPSVAMVLLISLLFYSKKRDHWKVSLAYIWVAGLVIMGHSDEGRDSWIDSGGERSVGRFASDPHALRLRDVCGVSARDIPGPGERRSKMPAIRTLCILISR